jgi:hypothetical protein
MLHEVHSCLERWIHAYTGGFMIKEVHSPQAGAGLAGSSKVSFFVQP